MSNYSKIEKASFTTFLMGFALMFYGFYEGSKLEMGAQKENYLVLIIFSMVVILFSFFSYLSNPTK
jgi:uncharacterized membrane protein